MKFALAFAIAALGATGVAAYAHDANYVFIRHSGAASDVDADHDGWLTRAEASAGADAMFAELDTNHDGRLTNSDRVRMEADFDTSDEAPAATPGPDARHCTRTAEGDRVTIICNGDDEGESGARVERRIIVRHADHAAPHADGARHVERDVTIITRDGDEDELVAPAPLPAPPPEPPEAPRALRAPLPPHPPHPPMFMMLMANTEESDTNHDGAISRDEFRAQQLRFFDASDANGDGRIRFEPPPEAPLPPTPPAAPPAPTPPPAPR